LRHSPVHIYRAILEGICYGTEYIFRTFRQAGYRPKEIYACGGATNSRLWMQLHADVSGIPIQIPMVQDAPLLGSAILASVASGQYPNVKEAAKNMVHIAQVIDPNPEDHSAYKFYVDQYIATYAQLAERMHAMTKHTLI
jgi:sugar (pentulose or hexulose) kinase